MKANIEHLYPGIYCIINKVNNKKYVGKAKNIHKRIKWHIAALNAKSKDENRYLINSWHKHGRKSFDYIVLERLPLDEILLSEKELHYQDLHKVHIKKFGYNLRRDSSTGMIVSEETKQKLKEASKNRHIKFPHLAKQVGEKTRKMWENNHILKKEMSEKVSKIKTNYHIVKMDYNLNILDIYESCKYIKDNTSYYLPAVLNCCNGNKNAYLGYLWRYKDIKTGKIIEQKHPDQRRLEGRINQGKKIYYKDKTTGNVSEYPTLKIFSEKIGISYAICFNIMRGKVKNTSKYPFIISYEKDFNL